MKSIFYTMKNKLFIITVLLFICIQTLSFSQPAILLSPNQINFGIVSTSNTSDSVLVLQIKNIIDADLQVDSINGYILPFSFDLATPTTVPAGDSIEITITLHRDFEAGVYSQNLMIFTDTTDGIVVTQATLVEPVSIILQAPLTKIACVNDSIALQIQVTGTLPITYRWQKAGVDIPSATDSILIFNPLLLTDAGTYSCIVSNSISSDTTTNTILTTIAQPAVNLGNDTTLCTGAVLALDAGAGFSDYLWSNGFSNQILNVIDADTYWVQVTNFCGTARDSIVVSVLPIPSISLGNDTIVCQGVTLTLDAGTGFDTYIWNTGQNSQTIAINSTGNYSVTATNLCGTATDAMQMTVVPIPYVNLGNDTTLCAGAILALDAGAGFSDYLWSNGFSNQILNVTDADSYWVQVTNFCGTARDTIVVSVLPIPAVSLGNDTIVCQGVTLTLDAGTGFDTYIWNTGQNSQTISINSTGNYSVTATNLCGTATDAMQMTVVPIPYVNLGNDTTLCAGNSVILDAGAGFDSYQWQNGTGNQTFTASSTGEYSVTIGNICGTDQDTIQVVILPIPAVNLGVDTAICFGNSITFDAGAGFNYTWINGGSTQIVTTSLAGLIWVQINNICGNDADSVEVTITQTPSVNFGADTTICQSSSLHLDAGIGFNYLWSTGGSQQILTVSTQGTYWVRVSNQCGIASDTIVVSILNLPVLNLGRDTAICAGDSLILRAGAGFTTYLWQNNTSADTVVAKIPGTFWVEVSNRCGNFRDSLILSINPTPLFTLGTDKSFCSGTFTTLDAGDWETYLWQDSTTNQIFRTDTSGLFWAEITDANHCSSRDSIFVNVWALPSIFAGGDQGVCVGTTVSFTATGGISYNWIEGVEQSVPFTAETSKQFIVTGFDANGCSNTDTANLYVGQPPRVNYFSVRKFQKVEIEAIGDFLPLTFTLDSTIVQDNGTFTPVRNGNHVVTISDANGCTTDTTFRVFYNDVVSFLPAFTPNGDLINDTWDIGGIDDYPFATIIIYNRWNQIIAEYKGSAEHGWDGNSLGRAMPMDTYWFQITLTRFSLPISGHFTLIR